MSLSLDLESLNVVSYEVTPTVPADGDAEPMSSPTITLPVTFYLVTEYICW